MPIGQDDTGKRVLKFAPRSPATFLPPRQADAITEMAALQRDEKVWNQVLPILDALYGKTPSIYGGPKWDRARLIILLSDVVKANGYMVLGSLNDAQLSRTWTFGYKRNTGDSFPELIEQGNQLRLEHKEAMKNAAE